MAKHFDLEAVETALRSAVLAAGADDQIQTT